MKKTHTFVILFLFISFFTNAQKEVLFQAEPLVLVNDFKTNLNSFIIWPDSIEGIDVLKDSAKIKPYGAEGKNGVILITPKKNTILLTAADIISKFINAPRDRYLRFAIDKTIIKNKSEILIEESEIFTVTITTDVRWINTEDANSTERFINITTIEKKEN
jgi:hypothetical protein